MPPPQVSRNIVLSKNEHMAYQDYLPPLPHNLRRNRPFILVGKLTNITAETIKSVSGDIGG